MSQQFSWGNSNQQSARRGLTPISTSASRNSTASNSPSRNSFSPVHSTFHAAQPASNRHITSRTSSASSTSSPFSPSQPGAQQPQPSQLLSSSTRARTIASTSSSQPASSAGAQPAPQHAGGGSGGGASKLARASPSLSHSSTIASPSSGSNPGSLPPGQSLSKIVVAQVFLLLSSIKENKEKDRAKWETQVEQIRKLIDSNGMDVFTKYFRRLLTGTAPQIFSGKSNTEMSGDYQLLKVDMDKLSTDPVQAYRIAESIDTPDGDLFRDFDLSQFMNHFGLSPVAKTSLCLALKSASKPDLKAKADAILSNIYQNFLGTIADPANDIPTSFLASVIDRLIQQPPRNWNDDNKHDLLAALDTRYTTGFRMPVPAEITSAVHLVELLEPQNPLARLVQRAGPKATSTVEACKDLLASAPTPDISYLQVANALLFMVITQNGQSYNPSNFVSALREHRAGGRLDWTDVVHAFDREGLKITKQQFLSLYNALLPLARDYENFDIQLLWGGAWANSDAQLSFTAAFTSCSPSDLDLSQIPRLRRAFAMDLFEDVQAEVVKEVAAHRSNHPFISLEATTAMFTLVFRSQESYAHASAMNIVNDIINPHSDVFLVAAMAVPKPWGGVQEAALKQLLSMFVAKHMPTHEFVFHGLWKQDRAWLATRLNEIYVEQQLRLTSIFEHAQMGGWLEELIMMPSEVSLDLAAFAHGRGIFEVEPWAHSMFETLPKEVFPRVLAAFLQSKAESDLSSQRERSSPTTVPLTVKTVHKFLDLLQGHLSDEELVSLQRSCIQTYPRLINYGEGHDEVIDANGRESNAIPDEIDAKMQEHYKNMYGQESDVRDIVQTLQRYKASDDPAEQDLFACMIHGLFDEYNCFSEYPLEALATTAVLFGGIINYNLLSKVALQAGLAMVLEAVQDYSPQESMYKFGLQALIHFQERLQEWPTFCDRLLQVPGLHGTEIFTTAQDVSRNRRSDDANGDLPNGPDLTNGNVDDFLAAEPAMPTFSCLHVDPASRAELYEDPEEDVQDRVLFVLNNVSERNLKDKLGDLKSALEERHHQWFAKYLVEERAKMQPNFQQLYLDMLQLLDDKSLFDEVLRETYVSSFHLLNSESTMTSSQERQHLKNLGGWLGSLTIARDKPIKYRNISFKDLLVEGVDTQRLQVVIPFTCKVLVQAHRSRVFRPPNPWLMEIIRLLVELYRWVEMKLQLKFEIEVLCKDLLLDHKTIEPSDYLRTRPTVDEELLGSHVTDGMEGFNELSLVGLNRTRGHTERFSLETILGILPDITSLLFYPESNTMVSQQQLKSILLLATQQAVREIIAPVVERSVTIAAISASQLVAKDFATEPDEVKFREAAHTMVRSLSGSLALVTCKEPLKMSITNNIRIYARDLPEQAVPEGLILMFVNENLDIVCSMIEEAAENQSTGEIDMLIEEPIRMRRLHRSSRPNDPFQDPLVSRWASYIPEPYRQEGGRPLNSEQTAIYEEFGRQSRGIATHANNASQDSGRQLPDILQEPYHAVPNLPTPAEAPAMPRQGVPQPQRIQSVPPGPVSAPPQVNGFVGSHNLTERIQELYSALRSTIQESPDQRLRQLSPESPVQEMLRQLVQLLLASPSQEHLTSLIATQITQLLFADTTGRFEMEVMASLLSDLCRISNSIATKVVAWLAGLGEEIFNLPVAVALLQAGLLDLQKVDLQISAALQQRRLEGLDFLAGLIDDLLLDEHSGIMRADLASSLSALAQWLSEEPNFIPGRQLMSKLDTPAGDATGPDRHDQLDYLFDEWVHLQTTSNYQKTSAAFVHQLHGMKVIDSQEDTDAFLRTCIDAAVMAYEAEEAKGANGDLDTAYIKADALAQLIVALTVYQGGAHGAVKSTKTIYLEKALCLLVLVLLHHHRARLERFNPKVFFRIISIMLCELHDQQDALAPCYNDVLTIMGRTVLALQPKYAKGFSFAWLALLAQRIFMPEMLKGRTSEHVELYTTLIEALLTFTGDLMAPLEPSNVARIFYRGVLRVLLVIHHDFPEFLAENHFRLCNSIPMHCTQLRNLVVSAYPSAFPELPDPFAAGLKVDRLEDMQKPPIVRNDIEAPLRQSGMKSVLDRMLASPQPGLEDIDSVCDAVHRTQQSGFAPVAPSHSVDTAILHAIVLYVGAFSAPSFGRPGLDIQAPATKLLERLVLSMRPNARYHLISAMANQLRWPNSHTHYFSSLILYLFTLQNGEQEVENLQQQITRVLLERLLVHRPHPWGLIITLLEVLKNNTYRFWELPFIKESPEVERLFGALFTQINHGPRIMG